MFADDTKKWTRLTNPTDAESLQKDLDSLSTWSARWQLKFNPEKCKLMHIGHKQDTSIQSVRTILIGTYRKSRKKKT